MSIIQRRERGVKEILDAEKTREDWGALPDVVVLNVSIVNAVVCAKNGVPKEEIERVVNHDHATGISSSWSINEEEIAPEPCKDGRPDATHYLLTC
jgi:hypothetical protein